MSKEIRTGVKVVARYRKSMRSCVAGRWDYDDANWVKYERGRWVKPHRGDGPLAVFDAADEGQSVMMAMEFVRRNRVSDTYPTERIVDVAVYRCDYVPSEEASLWSRLGHYGMSRRTCFPPGTALADKVMLTEPLMVLEVRR